MNISTDTAHTAHNHNPNVSNLKGNGLILPILLSLIGHMGILALIFLLSERVAPPPIASSIETTLISPDEFANIQQQLQNSKNRPPATAKSNPQAQAKSAQNPSSPQQQNRPQNSTHNPQNPTQPPAPMPQNDRLAEYKRQLAQKEAAYKKTIEQMANQLDKEFQEEMRQQIETERQKQREIYEQIKIFKQAEQQKDSIEETNRQKLKETADKLANQRAEANKAKTSRTQTARSEDNAESTQNNNNLQNNAQNSQNNPSSGQIQGAKSTYQAAIIAKIQQHFNPPMESQNKTSVLTLRLDNQGKVLSAHASGADARVNQAAEDAAYQASPLPIDPDNPQAYNHLRVTIRGQ